jgi:hypothetical protein
MTSLLTRNHIRTVSTALVVLTATLLLPLLFHLLPAGDGAPLGARLLPIFYAPFLAAVFFHPVVGITAALLAPTLNHALTGRPAPEMVVMLTLELLLFVGFILLMRGRWPSNPVLAPMAYILGHLIVAAALGASWQMAVISVQTALPGVGILFVMNLMVVLSRRNAGVT